MDRYVGKQLPLMLAFNKCNHKIASVLTGHLVQPYVVMQNALLLHHTKNRCLSSLSKHFQWKGFYIFFKKPILLLYHSKD